MVPTPSARRTRPTRGIFPFLMNPACSHTPTSVPTLSNRSTKRKAKMISSNPRCIAPRKSSCSRVLEGCGIATRPDGHDAIPRTIPNNVVPSMPSRMAPLIRRAINISVSTMPKQAACTARSEKFPILTNVAGFATTSLALRMPTNAMNSPMPAAVECFRQSGIPSTICSRTRVTVRRTNSTPEKKTTPSAVRHGICMPMQIE